MTALRHLKRQVQRANRDTCNHPKPRFKVGSAWSSTVPGVSVPLGYVGRRAVCADCGIGLLCTRRSKVSAVLEVENVTTEP